MLTQKCPSAPTHRSKMISPGAEIIIKMPSMLNVSNGSSKPEKFNLNNIEVLVDSEGQNWFKQAHVEKFFGLKHIDTLVGDLDRSEIPTRNDIQTTLPSPRPPRGAGLGLRIIKIRRINSSQSLGLCVSL